MRIWSCAGCPQSGSGFHGARLPYHSVEEAAEEGAAVCLSRVRGPSNGAEGGAQGAQPLTVSASGARHKSPKQLAIAIVAGKCIRTGRRRGICNRYVMREAWTSPYISLEVCKIWQALGHGRTVLHGGLWYHVQCLVSERCKSAGVCVGSYLLCLSTNVTPYRRVSRLPVKCPCNAAVEIVHFYFCVVFVLSLGYLCAVFVRPLCCRSCILRTRTLKQLSSDQRPGHCASAWPLFLGRTC